MMPELGLDPISQAREELRLNRLVEVFFSNPKRAIHVLNAFDSVFVSIITNLVCSGLYREANAASAKLNPVYVECEAARMRLIISTQLRRIFPHLIPASAVQAQPMPLSFTPPVSFNQAYRTSCDIASLYPSTIAALEKTETLE